MSGASEFNSFFDDDRRRNVYRGIFDSYYNKEARREVIFDTNRSWTGRSALINNVFPTAKIICCVRDIGWIIDSIERMLRQNALQTSRVFKFLPGSSVYSRVETLMNSEDGLIGLAWSNLREIWFSEQAHRVILVRYESLTQRPEETLRAIYKGIGEPAFSHDFLNVGYDEPLYDADLGMPGLHRVRERVEFIDRQQCIPPDLFVKYSDLSFWARPDLNRRGATVL